VQVERDGVLSNTVTVSIVPTAPQIAAITDTSYNLLDATHPAKAGETLIVWAIGLGATNPPVETGAAAPYAVAVFTPEVRLLGFRDVQPAFAGLSPGSAGLYQVIVKVPDEVPRGMTNISLGGNWLRVTVE
jgi:uncharacterized protein (TIGR03437 family)